MKDQKQLKNVKFFNYFSSMTANAATCSEIKSMTAMAKSAFNNKTLSTSN